jgi:hypothetical protein
MDSHVDTRAADCPSVAQSREKLRFARSRPDGAADLPAALCRKPDRHGRAQGRLCPRRRPPSLSVLPVDLTARTESSSFVILELGEKKNVTDEAIPLQLRGARSLELPAFPGDTHSILE